MKRCMLMLCAAAVACVVHVEPGRAGGDAIVYAFDMRGVNEFFTFPVDISDVDDRTFIEQGLPWVPFGMDFDLEEQTLYAVDPEPVPNVWGTVDLDTGEFNEIGAMTGDAVVEETIGGVAFAPDGTTYISSASALYTIDIDTAQTALVGTYSATSAVFVDIAVDNDGNMFGHSVSDSALYSIDPQTAETTYIGWHGLGETDFAQGWGFDRSTNELYATLYHGGGESTFVRWDTETGEADPLLDLTEWDAEMTMAIRSESSDACPADLTGDGSVGGADLGTMLSAWGSCEDPDNCPSDLTGDGNVAGADLGILLSDWGPCP